MAYPVAAKTQAAGVSAAVAGAVLYLAQTYLFKGSVPAGVESLIYTVVPGVVAFAAAWLAPHQVRPGDTPAPAPVAPPAALSAIPITPEQMAEIRDVLAHEQGAADERKVTIAQMVPPSTGTGGTGNTPPSAPGGAGGTPS